MRLASLVAARGVWEVRMDWAVRSERRKESMQWVSRQGSEWALAMRTGEAEASDLPEEVLAVLT